MDVASLADLLLETAKRHGSFEYQGQKCSAASRVYAPSSLWPELRERLADQVAELKVGDVSDFGNFMGAVIDSSSFATQKEAIEEALNDASAKYERPGADSRPGGRCSNTSLTSTPRLMRSARAASMSATARISLIGPPSPAVVMPLPK